MSEEASLSSQNKEHSISGVLSLGVKEASQFLSSLLIFLLRVWHRFLSPLLGERCRFYPSCSQYAAESLRRFGLFRGFKLACKRVCQCHPFCEGGVDLVPECSEQGFSRK